MNIKASFDSTDRILLDALQSDARVKMETLAEQVGLSASAVQRRIVRKWGERFLARRLDGLTDLLRPGRPPVFPPGGDRRRRAGGLHPA